MVAPGTPTPAVSTPPPAHPSRKGGPLKPRSPLTILVAALLLSGSVLESRALAQAVRVGPTFTINRLSDGRVTGCRYTDVAWDPVNQVYLVVWGAFGEVLGRFVTPDGDVLGLQPFVIPTTSSYTDAPRLAYSPDAAEFMVVWRDNRQDPTFPTVWGRQLAYQDASGIPRFIDADFPDHPGCRSLNRLAGHRLLDEQPGVPRHLQPGLHPPRSQFLDDRGVAQHGGRRFDSSSRERHVHAVGDLQRDG